MKPPKFSICIITKNESKTLPRLLASLKGFNGEVYVCDTGSTDSTVSIAQAFGCVVEELGGEFVELGVFNFSRARNWVADMAAHDMILSLDADEVITKMDIGRINNLIDAGYRRFDHIQIFTHDAQGESDIEFIQSKFYDRRDFHWENYTHEMLVGTGKKTRLHSDELRIEHWQNKESNRAGYIKGLERDVREHPEKDRQCHYYARELFYAKRYPEARKEFMRHLAMKLPPQEYDTTPTHMDSMLFLGNICAFESDLKGEVEWYEKAIKLDPLHRNPVVRMAHFYKWHNNKEKAREWAFKAKLFPWDEKYGASQKHFHDEVDDILRWAQLIPKRIITIWLGGEMPENVKKCIETHKLPGYEHMMITNDNYKMGENLYVDQCVNARLFAKATDFLRMQYLEKYGGIYLDADVKVLKPFDDLLDNQMFVCEEENGFVSNAIVGSIAGHPILQEYLREVATNFRGEGDLVFQPGMQLWTELIKYRRMPDVKVYPPDWFIPFNHQTGVTNITPNSHTVHLFNKSWL